MKQNKVIYFVGYTVGTQFYSAEIEAAKEVLTELGYTIMSSSPLPEGLADHQRRRIIFAMIDAADAVVLAPNSDDWGITSAEVHYARCTGKPEVEVRRVHEYSPPDIVQAWLKHDLEEVFGSTTNSSTDE